MPNIATIRGKSEILLNFIQNDSLFLCWKQNVSPIAFDEHQFGAFDFVNELLYMECAPLATSQKWIKNSKSGTLQIIHVLLKCCCIN